MAEASMSGSASERASLILTFDLDQLAVGAGVAGLSSPLQKLLAELPSSVQAALAWLPDLDLTQALTLLNLQSGDFSAYVAVSDDNGNQLASTFVFLTSVSGEEQAAFGLSLDLPVDLGAIPLFGALLAGIKITGAGVTYASQQFAADSIVLPPGAASTVPAVPSGLGLVFTVDAEGSVQKFTLPEGSSGTDGSASQDSPPPLAPALDQESHAGALASQDGAPPVSWFTVQKSFGPLSVDRVGVVAGNGALGLALDAALNTDVVDIQLTGFTISFPPGSMGSAPPTVDLDGLAVAVDSGPLQIGGSLARTQGPSGTEYDGSVLLRIGSYAINAAGSYAVINGTPSLFVFGIAEGEFGGPPAFFVTGLAAGFGLNRALRLPAADQVGSFPIIEAAQGAGDALAKLNTGGWVPPAIGEYWVAAGIEFRSFELINGFVLVTVEFGKELVIALLGAASLQLPTEVDGGPVFGYIEITLEAVLRPQEGVLSIEALLTPNSYVIDPACQLTGGMAFDLWFGSNPHAGDFVFTVGGYNSLFQVPSWYPTVPRLGFSWQLSDAIQIVGQSYFALTPSCVMGGGLLSLTFDADGLHAWFTAQADFIMYWRPFWFDIDVSVSIGVSYTGTIAFVSATFTVELGVAVQLWGPPLQGVGHVNWWVISFDVAINGGGSPSPKATTLADWPTFASSSLPKNGTVCRARPAGGLQSIINLSGGATVWLFSGDSLALATETVIPASEAVISGTAAATLSGLPVSVYPLGNAAVSSAHQVCVAPWTGTDWQPGQPMPTGVDVSGWGWATVTGNLPASLWGQRSGDAQASLGSAVVSGVVGVTGTGQATFTGDLTVQVADLLIDELPARGLPLASGPGGSPGPAAAGDARSQVAATINASSAVTARNAVAAVANASGLGSGLAGGTLPLLAAEVYAVLTDPPMLGPLSSTGPPTATPTPAAQAVASRGPITIAEASAPPRSTPVPVLRALFRQDGSSATATAGTPSAMASRMPPVSATVMDRWSTGRDMRLAARVGPAAAAGAAAAVPEQAGLVLWPGMTGVWDLPIGGRRGLRCDNASPLWIVALDAANRVCMAEIIQAAGAAPEVMPTAARVAVTALWDQQDVRTAGWHASTVLRQIASQALVGDGIVLRPQSPCGLPYRRSPRRHRFSRELGVTTGRRLVDRNWTQEMGGGVRRGWVETFLPAWCETVLVGAVPEGSDEGRHVPGLQVQLHRWRDGQPRMDAVTSAATESHRSESQCVWQLLVPGAAAASQLVVRATAPEGWRLDGVYGFASPPADWASWPPTVAATGPRMPSRVQWE